MRTGIYFFIVCLTLLFFFVSPNLVDQNILEKYNKILSPMAVMMGFLLSTISVVSTLHQLDISSNNQFRPLVIIDIRFNECLGIYELILTNIGETPAKKVLVKFKISLKDNEGKRSFLSPYSRKTISFLSPKKEITYPLRQGYDVEKIEVKISYKSLIGNKKYKHKYVIDLKDIDPRTNSFSV